MRLYPLEKHLISDKVLNLHREEIEYKLLSCYTNINNLKFMINSIKKDLLTADETWKKVLDISLQEQENQLKTHIVATKQHKKNLAYLFNL